MSHRFIMLPVGSSGDVHPFVGVGVELRRRGHEVVVISGEPFQRLIEATGLSYVETFGRETYAQVVDNPDVWHARRGLGHVIGMVAQGLEVSYRALEAAFTPDATLVLHPLSMAGRVFQDRHDPTGATLNLAAPSIRTCFQTPPLSPGVTCHHWPHWLKRSLWWMVDRWMLDPHMIAPLNALRRDVGLGSIQRPFQGWIQSPQLSVAMFPDWFAAPQPDWPTKTVMTDFPLWDDAKQVALSPELEAFLDGGDPPIAFAPGSANRHGKRFFHAAAEATARLRKRALFLTPWPDQTPQPLPHHVHHVSYAPFSRVLPRCAAVVHHGGIGTSAQTLAAGTPHVVMPMAFDQPDNALRLAGLGVATWLAPGRFTGERLAQKLDALLGSADVAAACARYRDRLAPRCGLSLTADALEELAACPRTKRETTPTPAGSSCPGSNP